MKSEMRVVALDNVEHGMTITALNELRKGKLSANRPTRDIDDLLLKIIDAPAKKCRSMDYEAR